MLPSRNQYSDTLEHFRLGQVAKAAVLRGHELVQAGKMREAREALAQAEAASERQALIAEHWRDHPATD